MAAIRYVRANQLENVIVVIDHEAALYFGPAYNGRPAKIVNMAFAIHGPDYHYIDSGSEAE